MPRQARSEATRRRIVDSAVDLINQIGYPAAGLADIIERAELTKGALYYHFDSKEAVATAIIEEGAGSLLDTFRLAARRDSPAMENLVHGMLGVADVLSTDRVARAAARLMRTFGGFNPAAKTAYATVQDEMLQSVTTAAGDGDLRADADPSAIAETILAAFLGAEVLSSALDDGTTLRQRFARNWEILLAAVIAPDSQAYYQEFLARQSAREPLSADRR